MAAIGVYRVTAYNISRETQAIGIRTLGAAIVMLLLITVLASLSPARRAAGLDPNQALRDL